MRKLILLLFCIGLTTFSASAQMDEMDFIGGAWELSGSPIEIEGRNIHGMVVESDTGLVYENNDELAARFDTKVTWELVNGELVFEVTEASTDWDLAEKARFEYIYSEKDDQLILMHRDHEYIFDRVGQ